VEYANDKLPSPIFPTNDPSWSLFFEFAVNVAFGYLALRARKIHIIALTFIGMLWLFFYVRWTGVAAPGWGAENIIGGIPRTIFGFFSGVFLFMNFEKYRRYLTSINPIYIAVLLVVVFIKSWGWGWWANHIWLGSVLFFVPLLVAVGSISNPTNSFTARVFHYLGWISYPVYCLHVPIYLIFTILTDNADYGILGALMCAPVVILVSHLVTKHMEEPVRDILANRYLKSKSGLVYPNVT
jgi:peptidoglycan/LPS O-acetylase OafA/YrhL